MVGGLFLRGDRGLAAFLAVLVCLPLGFGGGRLKPLLDA